VSAIQHVYTHDFGTIIVPPNILMAAGYRPGRKMHWRVKRRIEQWGAWMASNEH
jgi:hypothetical protein